MAHDKRQINDALVYELCAVIVKYQSFGYAFYELDFDDHFSRKTAKRMVQRYVRQCECGTWFWLCNYWLPNDEKCYRCSLSSTRINCADENFLASMGVVPLARVATATSQPRIPYHGDDLLFLEQIGVAVSDAERLEVFLYENLHRDFSPCHGCGVTTWQQHKPECPRGARGFGENLPTINGNLARRKGREAAGQG